ncbi:unnamed protein product [Spirodela intermedia]|uniref:Reverse transcriptase/retrotransposon-derived protein RNase H-like domain-containing protein n=1 Tax=Spirodela intermedia TaxID=51605 RepID=A0A7I8IB12_SPIIN|nr:unnamed protein product [Spirodela intermedia]CAA6654594.1 unnamed protein product [Spirodela intermedia]
MTEHLQHMRKVFSILSTNSLHINAKKCRFRESKLEYLGHWVSVGVEVDKEKISAMTNWPIPRNLKELRGFLGLTGYYRKFIANYASIAWPLTQLLRKDAFCWSREAQATFSTLKQAMTMAPVLTLPNFSQEFIVETDASGSSVGAILMQQGRPIAYFSQALPRRAKLKLAYERELMAIVLIVRKWRHYLICQHFIIKID